MKYTFGKPYGNNYYAGDWMLGPNSFCMVSMCRLGYSIHNNIRKMKPRNYAEIEAVLKHIKDINVLVSQFISNMKLGILTGMVRTQVECQGGLDIIKMMYEKIADNGPGGKAQKTIRDASFLYCKRFQREPTFLAPLDNKSSI